MKKKILFVMNNLNCGGAEKALVSLLQVIDYEAYEVDLFLFKHEGLFLSQVPGSVNLLAEPKEYRFFDMSFPKALMQSVKMMRPDIFFSRIAQAYIFKTEKSVSIREQKFWKYLSRCLKNQPKKYDLAVGYLQRGPNYYCIDKVNATKKTGFVHNDYEKLGMDIDIDRPYLMAFDKIFTVSESCESILHKIFPDLGNKVEVMYNIVSPDTIRSLSVQPLNLPKSGHTIVSVGRLSPQKGYEFAVEACKLLKDAGFSVKWYILGEGEERKKLEGLITQYGLENDFILEGIIENPYPYLKAADVYVQTSRFEGKSIAIDEAKILCKPIVITNFDTAKDQISHGINGLITEMNGKAAAEGIMKIFNDRVLVEKLVANLSQEHLGNEQERDKLFDMLK
jgi:glycosyltransferase involved in cell wall biosynthesis